MQKYIYLFGFFLISACATLPTITKFEINPSTIHRGETAKISWQVNKSRLLRSVRISGMDIKLYYQGELDINPQESQSYILTIEYKKGGKIFTNTRAVDLTVAPKVKFTGYVFRGTDSIYVGDAARISWRLSPESQQIRLQQIHNKKVLHTWDNLPSDTILTVRPIKTSEFKLTAIQAEDDTLNLSHTVKVITGFFSGNRQIVAGDEAELIWQVHPNVKELILEKRENAYTAEVIKHNLPLSGSEKVKPEATTEYLLALIGNHEVRFDHKVEVLEGILNGQKFVQKGESATLLWRVNPKANKVWLEQEKDGAATIVQTNLLKEGRIEIKPEQTTDYHLVIQTEDKITKIPHKIIVQSTDLQANSKTYNYQAPSPFNSDMAVVEEDDIIDDITAINEPHLVSNNPTLVFFDFNKSKVKVDFYTTLNNLAIYMKKYPKTVAEVSGYADAKGTTEGCMRISKERTQSIKEYLMERGVPAHRILSRVQGRVQPIWFKEKTDEQAQENRRVEILLLE
jgi:outer membrane protein OmpA-like peptidoglycan-associated protein